MLPQPLSIPLIQGLAFAKTLDDKAYIDTICASTNHL